MGPFTNNPWKLWQFYLLPQGLLPTCCSSPRLVHFMDLLPTRDTGPLRGLTTGKIQGGGEPPPGQAPPAPNIKYQCVKDGRSIGTSPLTIPNWKKPSGTDPYSWTLRGAWSPWTRSISLLYKITHQEESAKTAWIKTADRACHPSDDLKKKALPKERQCCSWHFFKL
jgi:hypothetical protein